MDSDRIETFWQGYLDTLPEDSPIRDEEYVAEGWGDSPQLADELGALIAAGTKTATCSALWEYESEGSPLPEPGSKRSEEHTSELQSRQYLVCRLLLEKKNNQLHT